MAAVISSIGLVSLLIYYYPYYPLDFLASSEADISMMTRLDRELKSFRAYRQVSAGRNNEEHPA
jgi:hypothetical protein